MVGTPINSNVREVTDVVKRTRGQEGSEAIGSAIEQGIADDDEDSVDATFCTGEIRYPGWPGTNVFRMLIPATAVGAIIGHKGERVRRLCEETRACVRVIGGHLPAAERAVVIFAKEQPDEPIPPAIDALLRVHELIVNDDGLDMKSGNMVVARLLTPSEQAASLIGVQGPRINSIEEAFKTNIRIFDGDLPPVALEEDNIFEIWGQPIGVCKALELIASHLRKYLVHRSVIPLFDPHVPMAVSDMDMPPCHYNDHPEGPMRAISLGYHSAYAEDLQCQPAWVDACYSRYRHPMENPLNTDIFEYRWEAPSSFGRYRSVTPPDNGTGANGPEISSHMRTYLPVPMELWSHHNPTANGWRETPIGPPATVQRIRSLISVYGQHAGRLKQTYQSANIRKHLCSGVSLYGSDAHPNSVSPSVDADLPPTSDISIYRSPRSPSLRMYPSATVENLLHCRVSACSPEASPHLDVASISSQSPAVTSQVMKKMQVPIFYAEAVIGPSGERIDYIRRTSRSNILINDLVEDVLSIEITGSAATYVQIAEQLIKNFMAEAAAASPGHSYDFIPPYLPAPSSPVVDTSRGSRFTEKYMQMIY